MPARMCSTAAILALFVTCICNAQQPAKLRISGDGIQPLEITAADLARMPRLTLDVRDPHTGNVHQYGGVRLSDLLTKAVPRLGTSFAEERFRPAFLPGRKMDMQSSTRWQSWIRR
jgi:hypothetical protein